MTAVDGERQRLTVAQFLAYLPATAGRFEARRLDTGYEWEEKDASGAVTGGATDVTATYEDTGAETHTRFTVTLRDMIDAPMALARERGQMEQRQIDGWVDGYDGVTITDGTAGGLATLEIQTESVGPFLRMLIADRFSVSVQRSGGESEIEDFVAFVESSFLPALATAPAFADAGDPPVPEWAAAGFARSEEQQARGAREREASEAEAAAEGEAAGTLAACDDILSAADVAAVLGVRSVRVSPTPGVEVTGENCNRGYKPEGLSGAVLLIVSHYRNATQAESALRVASDHDGKVDLEPLAGGLNGVRYTHDLSSAIHVSHFASGVDFVELKAVASLDPTPDITPAQLAEITAIVAARLGE